MSPELIKRLTEHQPSLIGLEQCRQAAVLIPLLETPDGVQIVLEQRSPKLKHQPRDICLPGGAIEAGETPRQAAVREACEELLLRPEQIQVFGLMDVLHTNTLMLYPYAAKLTDYDMTYSAAGGGAGVLRAAVVFSDAEAGAIPHYAAGASAGGFSAVAHCRRKTVSVAGAPRGHCILSVSELDNLGHHRKNFAGVCTHHKVRTRWDVEKN